MRRLNASTRKIDKIIALLREKILPKLIIYDSFTLLTNLSRLAKKKKNDVGKIIRLIVIIPFPEKNNLDLGQLILQLINAEQRVTEIIVLSRNKYNGLVIKLNI